MTLLYNKKIVKRKRQQLRRNLTKAEKLVWMFLRKRQVKGIKFRRQFSIDQFIIDFYCPQLKLTIEIDGDVHEMDNVKDHDEMRQNYLEGFGIQFLRITNDEVFQNLDKVFKRIEVFISERSNTPT